MIGTTISHFKIVDTLCQGGMGKVYLAEDPPGLDSSRSKRHAAVRFLHFQASIVRQGTEEDVRHAEVASLRLRTR